MCVQVWLGGGNWLHEGLVQKQISEDCWHADWWLQQTVSQGDPANSEEQHLLPNIPSQLCGVVYDLRNAAMKMCENVFLL